ncbi:MAG: hypothetical protein M1839_008898 [Geoglossum umbratile]|nr:MAG: hypothetical protein M1839_008898 [Geoglossum umbratile]
MANLSKSEIIKSNPIGEGLNAFRNLFNSARADIPGLSDAVEHLHINDEGLKNLVLDLIWALQSLSAARSLPSPNGRGTLRTDLLRFTPVVDSGDFDIGSVIPLLNKVIDKAPDADIWGAVYGLITDTTPPPRPLQYLDRTPITFNISTCFNTSEHRKYFDNALKDELDSSLYIDIPGFFDAFFGEVTNLESVAEEVFRKCQEGGNPLYKEGKGGGWRDWPKDALENEVLEWFKKLIDMFLEFARENRAAPNVQRRPFGQPGQHLSGSTPKRKLDIGFVNGTKTNESLPYDWSQILVPGELKNMQDMCLLLKILVDMSLVLPSAGLSCDWEFDRLGGIASSAFDINKEGLQFVSAVLGYLLMDEEQLGFDPTITESDGKRYMEITRNVPIFLLRAGGATSTVMVMGSNTIIYAKPIFVAYQATDTAVIRLLTPVSSSLSPTSSPLPTSSLSPTSMVSTTSSTSVASKGGPALSQGAKIALGVSIPVVIAVVALVIGVLLYLYRRARPVPQTGTGSDTPQPAVETTYGMDLSNGASSWTGPEFR